MKREQRSLSFLLAVASALLLAHAIGAARAAEMPAGEPIETNGMKIAGIYLQAVEMMSMPAGQEAMKSDIHLEADIHAVEGNASGYAPGAWIPYLQIRYTLRKKDSPWTASGRLYPMVASDGPHYGANLSLDGPGAYEVVFDIEPPDAEVFLRHTDEETGLGPWWAPFEYRGDFNFIGTGKKGAY
jgi:uncharacterized protein involved in high-affinity Fe2+ transport